VTEFPLPTADPDVVSFGHSSPHDITLGPDGNLWFTEIQANQIGRIDPLVLALCGNGSLDVAEQCDDGNCANFDCCPTTYQRATRCRFAQKSLFLLKNNATDDAKDKVTWKWLQGAATAAEEFATPIDDTQYTLCLCAGGSSYSYSIPPGSNWQATGSKGYKYKDQSATPSGIEKCKLKSGDAGKSRVLVKGKGTNLADSLPPTLPLPVILQLINDANSTCFEGTYSDPDVIKNDSKQFKAKAQ
jgi:cysteine-rich repeat protein